MSVHDRPTADGAAGAPARRPQPWSPRRLRLAGAACAVVALLELAVVDRGMWHGRDLANMLAFYGALALLWTALTPLIARWMQPHGAQQRIAVLLAKWAVGIVAAGALDALVRRLVLTLEGTTLRNPFWLTWLYFLDVTAMQYGAIVLATRILEAHDALVLRTRIELTLRAQLARSRLGFLEAQLQPHFLFNTLGAVSELASEAPRTAAHMLRQLAALLRTALDRRGEVVRLHDELETLAPYLEIQRMRFADWLQIEQHVSPAARDVLVPRLLLQPLVENAIKHGLAGRSAKGLIKVIARVEDGRLEIAVRDNGVGLNAAERRPGYGIGLTNVRERLATFFDDDWQLTLDEAPRGGTVVVLSLPARYTPDAPVGGDPASTHAPAAAMLDFVRRYPIVADVLGWALVAAAWTAQSQAYLTLRGRVAEAVLARVALAHFTGAALWALVTPLVVALAQTLPIQREALAWRIAAHGTIALLLAVAQAVAWHRVLLLLVGARSAPPWPDAYVTAMFVNVFIYVILIGTTQYERATRWLRYRENTTEHLRAELEEARLQDATVRAQPETVLKTLEVLAERVAHDGAGTERALADLADRLRRTLDRRTLDRSRALTPARD